eukprot:CAMPEP_0170778146 /NCGR_PEP_ID=MMETSP0733-20121128/12218_1 /TAXON_ID=186038 /ORGANISM="Fragilariopsis kerguelensis, Strain L26-C5" /LENGTH=203 /DNA_ID=CAMNT_0011121515 /DNA_START=1 /DNA_END=610 /DNA_ORIENTATION=+
MSVYVDKSMENATETVMVEDGANCTMTVQNAIGAASDPVYISIVISIYVDESMENATETVMVENGANCTMTVQNVIGSFDLLGDKTPILHINYTIFHGDKSSIQLNPIVVASGQTSEQNTINFSVVPTCYFEKLVYNLDNTTIYTGTTPVNEAIDWLMNDKSGNSKCENPFFIERYALAVLSFSAPAVSATSTDNNRFLQGST